MDNSHQPVAKRSCPDHSKPLVNSWSMSNNHTSSSGGPVVTAQLVDKGIVCRWVRDDLEDKYLSLYQDHSRLKEKFKDQEEKIQEFKVVLKKKQDQIRQHQAKDGAGAAELRATDQMVKLEMRNLELEKQCAQLQQRLTLLQSQLESTGQKRPTGANTRLLQPQPSGLRQQRSLGRPEGPGGDKTKLQMANGQLMTEVEGLKDKLYEQEMEHQRRVQDLHSELEIARLQFGSDKRASMQEDLDKLRLQREVREKSAMLEHLQARCEAFDERERQGAESNSRLSGELERLNRELRRRDQEAQSMKDSSSAEQTLRRRIAELDHVLEDANKEAKLLRETNDKLMNSAFNVDRERQWQAREAAMQSQLRQLEATMHRDVGEKGKTLDHLEVERSRCEEIEKELSVLRIKCFELQEQNEGFRQKLSFFTQESATDITEMEDALLVVKQRRQQGQQSAQLDFLYRVDTQSVAKDAQWRLREIEAAHADTIQELEKTRQLLEAQYHINQDLKTNHSLTERQLEETRLDRDMKMAECAKLLDIRASRIRKLERQLRDVAYGTRQFAVQPVDGQMGPAEDEAGELLQIGLQNGENLVEIHIGRLVFTEDGAQGLGPEPALFCTWAFYACEMQTSDVIRGASPDFDKTVQYVVKVDDAFLHYVNKDKVKLELFQAQGMEYRSLAACRISVRELLDSQPTAPLRGRATFLTEAGDALGVLDYWLRMRVPMEQAMRLYRERAKALGYMAANQQSASEGLRALDESAEQQRPAGGAQSLDVKMVRCRDLKARLPDLQPSPYCSYKLFDCDDVISPAIPSSCNPEFHFHQRLRLQPGPALDKYLRTQQLVIWVLDEADPDQRYYLGVAKVDLVTLTQNKPLHGSYRLLGPDGQPRGTVDLEISWQFPYAPADSWGGWTEALPLLTGEAELLGSTSTPAATLCESKSLPPQMESPKSRPMSQSRRDSGNRQSESGRRPQQPPLPAHDSRQSSRAASVVEDSCIESIQGVDESAFRQHKQQRSARRGDSGRVARDLSKVLTAPADKDLANDSGESVDAESVHSLVPEPMKVGQPKPSLADAAKKLGSQTTDNNSGKTHVKYSASGLPSELQSKLLKEKQRQQEADGKSQEDYEEEELESEHESDDVVVESDAGQQSLDNCTVQIFHVHLDEQCKLLSNPDLNNTICYVSYQLPGYDMADTETPISLPTPRPGKSKPKEFDLTFNFQRTFSYSFDSQYVRRQKLAASLLAKSIELPFTVVCESADENRDFFMDLGQVKVQLKDLVAKSQEIKETTFPIISKGQTVGNIKVSTNLPCLLHKVLQELPEHKRAEVKLGK